MLPRIHHIEAGHGPPLLFLHGVGGSAASWQAQLDAFRPTHRAIAWDMPGYGASDPLPDMTIARLAQALDHFLRAQRIERPILVGHSLGGMIVQEYLATFPGQAAAVVLYATSPAFGPKSGAWQQEFLRSRLGPLEEGQSMADLAPAVVQSMVGPAAQPAGIALAIQQMAATPAAVYRASVLSLIDFDCRAHLAKINIPCLLITGSEDTIAPPVMMERMASKIPVARLVVLPGLGHLAHLEDAALFTQALHDFLATLN